MTLNEKRIERRKIWEKMKALNDKALAEKRDLSAEEQTQWKTMEADVDRLGTEVEADEARMLKAKAIEDSFRTTTTEPIKPEPEGKVERSHPTNTPEYRKAFQSYLIRGEHMDSAEARALQMDVDPSGGYTVAPQEFVNQLLMKVRNGVLMRQFGTVYPLAKAESLGVPTLENEVGDPTWTSEILTGSEDSTMSFGKRELRPHPVARSIKVSKKLIRASAMDVESIVRDSLAYKVGVVEENTFLNGTGVGQPLGVFTASAQGISTGQDVSTGNTVTSIMTDGLIEAKYTLKPQYWPNARWIFHREAVKQIRKLKDGDGAYIWKPGITADRGDNILDFPVSMSEYAPHTFTTTLYVGILGDFSKYWIADALDVSIQTLVELYAATNQNGYILRKETDGMPVLEEAFIRVALA